jgi:subtilisin family serine protease
MFNFSNGDQTISSMGLVESSLQKNYPQSRPEIFDRAIPVSASSARGVVYDPWNDAQRLNLSSKGKSYEATIDGKNNLDDLYTFSLGTQNQVQLSLESFGGNLQVELFDYKGKALEQAQPNGNQWRFNQSLESGAYKVRVATIDNKPSDYKLTIAATPNLSGITTTGSDELVKLHTTSSSQLINLDDVRTPVNVGGHPLLAGLDGSGFSTVIIDTGINLSHPAFGPDNNGDGVADRIRYHFDFANDDTNATDVDGHGTNVASIATSQAAGFLGVVPGSGIIPLKVFADRSQFASNGDIEQALQWVVANANTFNIASVNLSLGSGNANSITTSGLTDELQALANLGVIVVASAGNDFAGFSSVPGVSRIAAEANTISVGAVWDGDYGRVQWGEQITSTTPIDNTTAADRVVSFSQRHRTLLDIFAPGTAVTGAGLSSNPIDPRFTSQMSGTSMAAPHVSGTATLVQQLATNVLGRRLTPNEFRDLIQTTGATINDGDDENDNVTNTGANYRRLDVQAVANEILRRAGKLAIPTPSVNLTVIDGSAAEAGDSGQFRITRTGDQRNPLTVNYTIAGSATNGVDYNGLSGTATIAAMSDFTTITIAPRDDDSVEGIEQVRLDLIAGSGYQFGSSTSGTVTIDDNDFAPLPVDLRGNSLNVRPVSLNAGDNFNLDFQVENLGGGNAGGFRVNFYLSSDRTIDTGDTLLGSRLINGLTGNSNTGWLSQNLTLPTVWSGSTWRTIGDGNYTIGMIVDASNDILETNEGNNRNRGQLVDAETLRINNTAPVVTVNLPSIFQFRPNHTRGDREFFGHGPNTIVATNLSSNAAGTMLTASVSTFQEETAALFADSTTFSGNTSRSVDIAALFPNWRVERVLSATSDQLNYIDDDHATDVFVQGADRLVGRYEVLGDQMWADDPWVSIDFNPVKLRLRPA